MDIRAKSNQAEPKSAVVKDSADLTGIKALPAHNAPKADVSRAQTTKPSNRGTAKKSVMSAPAALGSKVEKKGSLGYMRMPVACGGFSFLLYEWALSYVTSTPRITGADSALGSCRRRKIRCILADDDSRERCVTCIRLKKTCAFHPPDGQHNDTARFQTFNNAGPTASLSTTRSFSFARQNLGWALGRAEQLESPPTSSSSAPILFADPRFGPWSTLPNGSVYGSSGFENDLTLLFAFQPSFADGLEPWNHLNRFSSEETMDREDNVSQPSRLSNLMVSAEHCAKFPSAEAVAWLPSQYNMSASYPSWAMSCGQTYPSISQVKLPTSFSTMGQQSHPEPLQLGRSLCETSEPEEWISQDPLMNDIHAKHENTEDSCEIGPGLALKLDGDLYKRRS